MRFLRSNTAVLVTVGPFYDKTDGVTIKTSLTITNEKITLTADTDAGSAPTNILDNVTGATSGTSNDLNYITGNDAGMMQLELAAADVNRVGRMFLSITDAANHCPVFHEFFVLPAAIYDWLTGVIVPLPANVTQLLGTAWLTPGTAGTPDVNAKLIGATAQTGGDIYPKIDTEIADIQARLPAALTANGNMKSSMVEILTTALTETAGLLAGGFKKFFNIASPVSTMDVVARVTLADTVTTYTGNTVQTGDAYARIGAAGAGLTAADDAVIAAIGALNNLSAAQVNAEVVDALATDTYAEPGQGAPAATASIAAKINYMFKGWRNKKTQTATDWKLFADDASTVDQKSTVSDDATTATKGEIAAGP